MAFETQISMERMRITGTTITTRDPLLQFIASEVNITYLHIEKTSLMEYAVQSRLQSVLRLSSAFILDVTGPIFYFLDSTGTMSNLSVNLVLCPTPIDPFFNSRKASSPSKTQISGTCSHRRK